MLSNINIKGGDKRMLRTFKIRALIKGKPEPVTAKVTVLDINNVKRGFEKHGHLILDHEEVSPDVKMIAKKLSFYAEV